MTSIDYKISKAIRQLAALIAFVVAADNEDDEDSNEQLHRQVPVEIEIEASDPPQVSEQVKLKAQELSCIAQRKAEKEEERRAREKIRQKLQQDKLERSCGLGLQKECLTSRESATSLVQERGKSLSHEPSALPVNSASVSEFMKECLRSLNRRNKDDALEVKMAFQNLFNIRKKCG